MLSLISAAPALTWISLALMILIPLAALLIALRVVRTPRGDKPSKKIPAVPAAKPVPARKAKSAAKPIPKPQAEPGPIIAPLPEPVPMPVPEPELPEEEPIEDFDAFLRDLSAWLDDE